MRLLIVPADRTEPHGGARNLGDAFLSDALASALDSRGHDATIYDFGPTTRTTSDRARHRGGRAGDLLSAIGRSDGVIVGGGTMLQDNCPDRLVGGLPRLCAVVSTAARARRTPLAFYGVGLDTLDRAVTRATLRFAVAGRPAWVRDVDSLDRYARYFGGRASLGADASLLADGLLPEPRGRGRRHLTIALNRDHAGQVTPAVLSDLGSAFDRLSFLSMDQEPDNEDAAALPAGAADLLDYRPAVLGWRDAAAMVASSTAVLGSRMHALYLAAVIGVPAAAVGTSDKLRSFCTEFDVPRFDRLSDYRPGSESAVDASAVRAARDRASSSLGELLGYLDAERGRTR